MAVDDSFVYFGESGLAQGNASKGVRRVPKNGGTVQRLYDNPVDLLALNTSATDLYLLARKLLREQDHITQEAKTGGQVKRSFNGCPRPQSNTMTIYDGRIYYYTKTKKRPRSPRSRSICRDHRLHVRASLQR